MTRHTTGKHAETATLVAIHDLFTPGHWRVLSAGPRHGWLQLKVARVGRGLGPSNYWLLARHGRLSDTNHSRTLAARDPALHALVLASLDTLVAAATEPWTPLGRTSWHAISAQPDPLLWDRVRLDPVDGERPPVFLEWNGSIRDTPAARAFRADRPRGYLAVEQFLRENCN